LNCLSQRLIFFNDQNFGLNIHWTNSLINESIFDRSGKC
jgi:hypothetical protein